MPAAMIGEEEEKEEKGGMHLFKRRKTSGNNILRKLSYSGNKKRESIIYKQMKDEMDEDEEGDNDQANVRFKKSVIQINQSNPNSPTKEVEKQGLFRRFRESFRLKNSRPHSASPSYGTLEPGDMPGDNEEEDKENMATEEPADVITADVITADADTVITADADIVAAEAEEFTAEVLVDDVLSDTSSVKQQLTGVEDQTSYKFSDNITSPPTWKQRLYRSFRKSKAPKKTEESSPTTFKRRYSLPSFKRKKKGLAYEAL